MNTRIAKKLGLLAEWLQDPIFREAYWALSQLDGGTARPLGAHKAKEDHVIGGGQYDDWFIWFTPSRMVLNKCGTITVLDKADIRVAQGERLTTGKTKVMMWSTWLGEETRVQLFSEIFYDYAADHLVADLCCWLASSEMSKSCGYGESRMPDREKQEGEEGK